MGTHEGDGTRHRGPGIQHGPDQEREPQDRAPELSLRANGVNQEEVVRGSRDREGQGDKVRSAADMARVQPGRSVLLGRQEGDVGGGSSYRASYAMQN